jgi:uncharacterized protein (DUF58 family)
MSAAPTSSSNSAAQRRLRAEQLAATLPPLLVAAERIAATVQQGVHGRRRVGTGEAFWQFRRYQAGDSPQRIDWRQSAKADPVFVREMEWAAAQSVWLWRDASASMRWRSQALWPEKLTQADLLTLALAVLLVRGGERVALLGSGQLPGQSLATLERMALLLERDGDGDGEAAGLPPDAPLPRHAQVIFLGDFLSPLPQVDAALRRFAERGVRGHILQILDPAEETLPFAGRIRFEGLEGEGEKLLSRVEMVRDTYVGRIHAHHEGLAALARSLGWSFAAMRTDRPPQTALLALYLRLSQAGMR